MPTVLQIGPYRLGFWSKENHEPPHVHVRRDRNTAKLWLDGPASVASNNRFAEHELVRIRKIVVDHRELLLKAWHEHFDNS